MTASTIISLFLGQVTLLGMLPPENRAAGLEQAQGSLNIRGPYFCSPEII